MPGEGRTFFSTEKIDPRKRDREKRGVAGKLLWDIYTLVYDIILLRSLPYRRMLEEVWEALKCNSGESILDAGCGTGNFLARAVNKQPLFKLVGMDASLPMLRRAGKKIKEDGNTSLRQADLNKPLPFTDEYFDAAVCINALYCVENPAFTLSEINRLLRKDGRLVLVTPPARPRMTPIFGEHARMIKQKNLRWWPIIFAGHLIYLLPFMPLFLIVNLMIKENRSFHFFKREELYSLVGSSGFEVEELRKTYGGQGWLLVGRKTNALTSAGSSEKYA